MFIYNFKINGIKTFKYFFTLVIILLVIILGIVMYRVFKGANSSDNKNSCFPKSNVYKIESKNYTNILKNVHENIDLHIGKKINFTGYVYRVLDLNENQFILARDMIINSNFQTVVVGFLCECENAKNFDNNTWINITGEIIKSNYHGDMPIIKITEINIVDKPSTEEYVYPPDDSYIPTSEIL